MHRSIFLMTFWKRSVGSSSSGGRVILSSFVAGATSTATAFGVPFPIPSPSPPIKSQSLSKSSYSIETPRAELVSDRPSARLDRALRRRKFSPKPLKRSLTRRGAGVAGGETERIEAAVEAEAEEV